MPTDDPRTIRVWTRLNRAEYDQLEEWCDREQRSRSDMLRIGWLIGVETLEDRRGQRTKAHHA